MTPLATLGSLQLQSAALSDVGRKRANNEDSFLADAAHGIYAVADGMGGHAGGEVASKLAIETLVAAMQTVPDGAFMAHPTVANRRALLEWLVHTVEAINSAVQARAESDSKLRGMGCTLDVALVRGGGLFLAHVGDSRVYVRRSDGLYRLTEDHSFGQMLLSRGVLTSAEVSQHPQRNVLTRAIGVYPDVQVDSAFFELDAGDTFLLCSDGLYNEVPDEQLELLLAEPPEQAVQTLIERALEAGGRDNVSAVVFRVVQSPLPQQAVIGAEATRRALAKSALFSTFGESELVRVQRLASGRVVAAGELVIEQGAQLNELCLVMSGQLSAYRNGERVGVLGPGGPFGAMSLSAEPSSDVSLRADEESRLLIFPLSDLWSLLHTDSVMAAKLAMAALGRVQRRLHQVVEALALYRPIALDTPPPPLVEG